MILIEDNLVGISQLKYFLSEHFEIKDLGCLSYFLGLEITSDSNGYYLSQAKFTFDILARACLTNSKTTSTPLELNALLPPLDDTPLSDATLYRQLVGNLVYLTVTRADIAYAVHLANHFLVAPRSTHYARVLRILCCVKETLFHGDSHLLS
ncbi:uncharacterized mitochondrial protein AtMg00810-like [Actinidia eriantha]|uniref:uncharacterized mitochondrial protein AtMg00810-like n=1 Tax=Actinidia eriantha TaxID=165200 RepID=UPI00258A7B70|nr:uncharacterized mitochondrial protein AtMg00810-like [Actinidia eriantha]